MTRGALAAAALVAAAALALAAMRWTTPGYMVLTGPIPVRGPAGAWVEGRTLAARIGTVSLAGRLRIDRYGKIVERETGGVWAVVEAEISATDATTTLGAATWIGPSGRAYAHSQRIEGRLGLLLGETVQPGLPRRGRLVFELPRDEVEGGELRLSQTAEPRLDSELRIALPTQNLTFDVVREFARDG